MTSNKRIMLIAIVSFLLLTGLVYLGLTLILGDDETDIKEQLVEIPGLPQDQWLRVIETKQTGTDIKITNRFDGYQIIIPSNWKIPESASKGGGFKTSYNPNPSNIHSTSEFNEGLLLGILTIDNPRNTPVQSWLRSPEISKHYFFKYEDLTNAETTQLGQYVALKLSGRLFDSRPEGGLFIRGDSSKIIYIIPSEGKMYIIYCWALGKDFSELAPLCEAQLNSFEIL